MSLATPLHQHGVKFWQYTMKHLGNISARLRTDATLLRAVSQTNIDFNRIQNTPMTMTMTTTTPIAITKATSLPMMTVPFTGCDSNAVTVIKNNEGGEGLWSELSLWLSSTLKKRKSK